MVTLCCFVVSVFTTGIQLSFGVLLADDVVGHVGGGGRVVEAATAAAAPSSSSAVAAEAAPNAGDLRMRAGKT